MFSSVYEYSNNVLCDNVTLLVLDNKARVYQPLIDQVRVQFEYYQYLCELQ